MRRELFASLTALMVAMIVDSQVSFGGMGPNLTLIVVYTMGLRHGHTVGMSFGLLAGMFIDSLMGTMMGPWMLSLATVGYLASYLREGIFMWTPLLGVLGVFFLTLATGALAYFAQSVFQAPPSILSVATKILILQAMINAPLGLAITPKVSDDRED